MFVDKIHSLWNWVFLGRGGKASRLAGDPSEVNKHAASSALQLRAVSACWA